MVKTIKADAHLAPYLHDTLEDAGIRVDVEDSLTTDDYVAIKVDDYFAGSKQAITPKAVDFVAVVDCQCNAFAMYILEFKNVGSPQGLNIPDIQEKFACTIDLFLSRDFSYIFLNDHFKYKAIDLYLVSDAYQERGSFSSHSEYLAFRNKVNKKDTLKVDLTLRSRLYKFRGKILEIKYDIPPNPVVRRVL